MSRLVDFKKNLREQWAWILLPVLFAICFITPNPTGATNLYRLFIVLPILLCFRPQDIAEIWANKSARLFLLFSGWMTLTLFWDGWSDKDIKLLLRELNVLALFYLIFLTTKFQKDKLPVIINSFLLFGFVGALLIIKDWEGIQYFQAYWHHNESARGIFGHHVEVGWALAVLGVVSLYQWLKTSDSAGQFLYLLAFLFFAGLVLFVQARGGYVVLVIGAGLTLWLTPGKKNIYLIVCGTLFVLMIAVLFQQGLISFLDKVIERSTALRLPIWKNAIHSIIENWYALLFGHGLSVSSENMVGNYKAAHFHNFFLNTAFYSGLVGLSLYLNLVTKLLFKAFRDSEMYRWAVVLVAMQVAFIPDGDGFFENPSATMLCLLLPISLLTFYPQSLGRKTEVSTKVIINLDHKKVFLVCLFVLSMFFWSFIANQQDNENMLLPKDGESVKAIVTRVPESGVITVNINGFPEFFGKEMPVLLAGIQRPFPWRYQCEEAQKLWVEGRNYLAELTRKNPEVEILNIRREKAKNIFRLEADIYIDGKSLANELVGHGYVMLAGSQINWCDVKM